MVSLGKTNTPEFGSPCYTEPDVAPPAVTPWDRDPDGRRLVAAAPRPRSPPGWCRWPRAPTAAARSGSRPRCCGLVGLKPTRGRISGHPMYGDPVGLATAGLARPAPCATRRRCSTCSPAGGSATRPGRRRPPRRSSPPATASRDGCGSRGSSTPVIADADGRPRVRRAPGRTRPALLDVARPRGRGHRRAAAARGGAGLRDLLGGADRAVGRCRPGPEHLLRPLTRWLAERGRAVSGPEFGLAIGAMRRFAADGADRARAVRRGADPDPRRSRRCRSARSATTTTRPRDFEAQKAFTPWTSAWNVTGMPAVSLPLHWTADGLPVGVMLAGPAGRGGAAARRSSAQVEAAAPWVDRHPPGW